VLFRSCVPHMCVFVCVCVSDVLSKFRTFATFAIADLQNFMRSIQVVLGLRIFWSIFFYVDLLVPS
jgi:hypothetical protein